MHEAPEGDVQRVKYLNARTWNVQKRIVLASQEAMSTKRAKPKREAKGPRVKVVQADRLEDLRRLGHDIYENDGYFKCSLCMLGARKTGLVKWVGKGSAKTTKSGNSGEMRE